MRGKFYAFALVAAFSVAATWTPDAKAQYYNSAPTCSSSYYSAPAYYTPANYGYSRPSYYGYSSYSNYGYSGYGYSGYASPAYGYNTYSGYSRPVYGGYWGDYGG